MEFRVLIGICALSTIHARLIQKTTEKMFVKNTVTPQLSLQVRLTRDLSDEDTLTSFSREYNGQSYDFVQTFRKPRNYYNANSPKKELHRKPRDSYEKIETTTKNNSRTINHRVKGKVLIKKPIPKFHELDYEDDFQTEVSKAPLKVTDSGDHEDEDFNVGDYEFDVNHDEFVGRGKPLEPRTKTKLDVEKAHLPSKPVILPVNVQEVNNDSKVVEVREAKVTERVLKPDAPSKRLNKSKEDYYYDDLTTMKITVTTKKEVDSDEAYEGEESKEVEKTAPARLVRSPFTEKLIEKIAIVK